MGWGFTFPWGGNVSFYKLFPVGPFEEALTTGVIFSIDLVISWQGQSTTPRHLVHNCVKYWDS